MVEDKENDRYRIHINMVPSETMLKKSLTIFFFYFGHFLPSFFAASIFRTCKPPLAIERKACIWVRGGGCRYVSMSANPFIDGHNNSFWTKMEIRCVPATFSFSTLFDNSLYNRLLCLHFNFLVLCRFTSLFSCFFPLFPVPYMRPKKSIRLHITSLYFVSFSTSNYYEIILAIGFSIRVFLFNLLGKVYCGPSQKI